MKITTNKIHGAGDLNSFDYYHLYNPGKITTTGKEQSGRFRYSFNNFPPIKCKISGFVNTLEGLDLTSPFDDTGFFDLTEGSQTITLYTDPGGEDYIGIPPSLRAVIETKNNIVTIYYQVAGGSTINKSHAFTPTVTILYNLSKEDIVFTAESIDFYKRANFEQGIRMGGSDFIVQDGAMKIPPMIDYQQKIEVGSNKSFTLTYNCLGLKRTGTGAYGAYSWVNTMEMYTKGTSIKAAANQKIEFYVYLTFKNPEE